MVRNRSLSQILSAASAVGVAGASLWLAACSNIRPVVAFPDAAQERTAMATDAGPEAGAAASGPWDRSLEGLRRMDQRVADIAYRIASANVALCSDRRPLTGLVLQSALEYSPRLRPAARRMFHLDDRPAVEAVAAGSPAARAGLRRDDIILRIGDTVVSPASAPAVPRPDERAQTYQPVADAVADLRTALARGPVRLTLLRDGRKIETTLSGTPGCAYDAQVIPGPQLNASADGKHVFVSTALVSYAASDDTLALILGHEYAHDLLHHHDRLDRSGFARNLLGEFGSTPDSLKTTEKEADYVGLYLTARAGYHIAHAPDFWRTFPGAIGDLGWSHPAASERVAALAATRDEIDRKRAAGKPLTPNLAH